MKRLWWALAATVVCSGCDASPTQEAGEADEAPEGIETPELGGLSLALTSVDSQGRSYRLRDATFSIAQDYWYYDGGVPQTTVLSTEDDPNASQLKVRLVPGQYLVTLGGDWYIERLSAGGAERVQQVVLLDSPTQYTYVSQDWNSELQYQFGVDGTLVDFRHGDLTIDIGIELPGDQPPDAGQGYPYPGYDAGVPPARLDAGTPSRGLTAPGA
jgi:hypothetical protein